MKGRLQGRLAGGKQISLDSNSVTYGGDSSCVECGHPGRINCLEEFLRYVFLSAVCA